MKRFSLFLFFLTLGHFACAQEDIQTKFSSKINVQEATKLLTILTSDEFAGRGTGEVGARKSADFIAEEFKKVNLSGPVNGSFFQPVPLMKSESVMESFRLGKSTFVQGDNFYLQSNMSFADVNAAELYLLNTKKVSVDAVSSLRDQLEGKVVLLLSPEQQHAENYLRNLLTVGAKLVIIVSDSQYANIPRFANRMGRGRITLADAESREAAALASQRMGNMSVAYITQAEFESVLEENGKSISKLQKALAKRKAPQVTTVKLPLSASFGVKVVEFADDNVLGFLRGSEKPEEVVVVMAHFDHEGVNSDGQILRGADDNGSGTVGVLLTAQAFADAAASGYAPKRSLLFLAVCAEEKGLLGSKYYAENPIFPIENTVAALNMDMIGRIDDIHLDGNHNYVHAIGANMLSSDLHAINVAANEKYTKMELDERYNDLNDPQRLYYRSDHYNFAKLGVPSIFYFSGLHPHYHTPEDTLDKINFEMLVKRTKLVFHTAWELANRAERIIVDKEVR